jgi:hypothetical protein
MSNAVIEVGTVITLLSHTKASARFLKNHGNRWKIKEFRAPPSGRDVGVNLKSIKDNSGLSILLNTDNDFTIIGGVL